MSSSSSAGPHPPEWMQTDDPAGAEDARRRVRAPKKPFFARLRSRSHTSLSTSPDHDAQTVPDTPTADISHSLEQSAHGTETVVLHGPASQLAEENQEERDVFRWAVLYENQRGVTIFSIPYYSSLSLLPHDPPPFTVPESDPTRKQPKVSLDEFPLPDGNWQWVSRSWMIDMRGDGAVQWDGFEYNWFFRRHHWRAEVGKMSAGGWVRRRRWVRLMVKPAKRKSSKPDSSSQPGMPGSSADSGCTPPPGSSYPPSVITSPTNESQIRGLGSIGEVWRGQAEEDWARCRTMMRRVGRDGRMLELWSMWLNAPLPVRARIPSVGSSVPPWMNRWSTGTASSVALSVFARDSAGTPDSGLTNSPVIDGPTAWRTTRIAISAVLREHLSDIMRMFIYPDSRARFLDLLGRAGLQAELEPFIGGENSSCPSLVDFWSYTKDD